MRSVTSIFYIMFALIFTTHALNLTNKEEILKASFSESTNANGGLSKKSVTASTAYNSSYFNVSYTCPTGWTITTFDSTPNSFSLTISKPLRSNVYISGKRFATALEASYYNDVSLFTTAKIAFNNSNDKMPAIYSLWDTTYSTGIKSAGINMKYAIDTNNQFQNQCFNVSESKSNYQHEIWCFTTVSDYTANSAEYSQHWFNVTFESTTLAKQAADELRSYQPFVLTNNTIRVSADQQKQLKLDLFDLLGKHIANIYNSEAGRQSVINLDNTTYAPSNYLIKASTTNGSTYYKVFIK